MRPVLWSKLNVGSQCRPNAEATNEGAQAAANASALAEARLCNPPAENRCPLAVIAAILGDDRLDVAAHYPQVSTRFMMDT
jgi:hypothetical protein